MQSRLFICVGVVFKILADSSEPAWKIIFVRVGFDTFKSGWFVAAIEKYYAVRCLQG
jgi:hypothetical protein